MNTEHLEIYSENFDDIVEDIKQRNLLRNNMPKLIVGTGLSVIYGVPGMRELADYLAKEIAHSSDEHIKNMWMNYSDEIKTKGRGKIERNRALGGTPWNNITSLA